MKKLIILTGAITLLAGTTLFANNIDNTQPMRKIGNFPTHTAHMGNGGRYYSKHCNGNRRRQHHIQNKEVQANQLDIAEKKIALKREMMKDTPDWNKVEQLNREIGTIIAENKTIMMKERMANKIN